MTDIRALAASSYNDAFEAVEAQADPLRAVELAATSLNLWRQVGNAQNLAIGNWLYSRALAKAGAGQLAIAAAEAALRHTAEIAQPADWLIASAREGLARALVAAEDPRATAAVADALAAIADIADPADRALIAGQIADLTD